MMPRALAAMFACLSATLLAVLGLLAAAAPRAEAVDLPPGFQMDTPIGGLDYPTTVDFAPDGRIFVGEREGRILVYDDADDPSPTVFADFRSRVFEAGDRGLLGVELDPQFPARPFVYVNYTRDAPPGEQPPFHGDICPSDPNGCIVTNRVAQLEMDPGTGTAILDGGAPRENWQLTGWCQQFTSHSAGDIEFDSAGALLASGGEGASFAEADTGQLLTAGGQTACGDPPNEGGALRSQDILTGADPLGYNGTILRLDPDTGAAAAGNPASADPRILAHGMRNPFRFELRPGSADLFIGDVGWHGSDEIDRIQLLPASPPNFGWPCFEGAGRTPEYDALDVPLCEGLYAQNGGSQPAPPFYTYGRTSDLYSGDPCVADFGAALAGIGFYDGDGGAGSFPASYEGAMFFADAARGCVWAMSPDGGGVPIASTAANFAARTEGEDFFAFNPVDVVDGPDGALYLPNFWSGEIARVRYFAGNAPPVARISASEINGKPLPRDITFDSSGSTDADGDSLIRTWDLDGDGTFGDTDDDAVTGGTTMRKVYTQNLNVDVSVRVTDPDGATDVDRVRIFPGNTPPEPVIDLPSAGLEWQPGDQIVFSGHATDAEDVTLPEHRLSWSITIEHCPSACHTHPLLDWPEDDNGSFTAPVHETPSHLVLTLTARDTRGMEVSTSRPIYPPSGPPPKPGPDPQSAIVRMASSPPSIRVRLGLDRRAAPFSSTLPAGAQRTIAAPKRVRRNGRVFVFQRWSDGGRRVHRVTAGERRRFRAVFRPRR